MLKRAEFWRALKSVSNAGMSLIEILIALTLLGLFGTFIATKIFDQLQEGKQQATKVNMQNLAQVLQEYRRHCGQYPSSEQGLNALISKPTTGVECKRYNPTGYIESGRVPNDAWDNPFEYASDGSTFKILSYGADGQEGGDGFNADLDSSKQ